MASLASLIKQHLSLPGDRLIDEVKKLTDKDKEDLRAEFTKMGCDVDAPPTK